MKHCGDNMNVWPCGPKQKLHHHLWAMPACWKWHMFTFFWRLEELFLSDAVRSVLFIFLYLSHTVLWNLCAVMIQSLVEPPSAAITWSYQVLYESLTWLWRFMHSPSTAWTLSAPLQHQDHFLFQVFCLLLCSESLTRVAQSFSCGSDVLTVTLELTVHSVTAGCPNPEPCSCMLTAALRCLCCCAWWTHICTLVSPVRRTLMFSVC